MGRKPLQGDRPRLQRHGVAGWLETSIGSCFCGEAKWYASIFSTTYDGSASKFEVNYPDCHRCLGSKSGQHAKSDNRYKHSHEEAREALCTLIAGVTGKRPDLEPGIEAYMYYGEHTVRNYPHTASDYYWGVVSYWPEDGTIRLHKTGTVLVRFPDPKKREWDVKVFTQSDDVEALQHAVEVSEAYTDYLQDHNHRSMSMTDARGRMTWLLGEWLMERNHSFYTNSQQGPPPPLPGFRMPQLVFDGIWQPPVEG